MDETEFVLAYLNTYDPTQQPQDLLATPEKTEDFFARNGLARPSVEWGKVTPRLRETRDGLRQGRCRLGRLLSATRVLTRVR